MSKYTLVVELDFGDICPTSDEYMDRLTALRSIKNVTEVEYLDNFITRKSNKLTAQMIKLIQGD